MRRALAAAGVPLFCVISKPVLSPLSSLPSFFLSFLIEEEESKTDPTLLSLTHQAILRPSIPPRLPVPAAPNPSWTSNSTPTSAKSTPARKTSSSSAAPLSSLMPRAALPITASCVLLLPGGRIRSWRLCWLWNVLVLGLLLVRLPPPLLPARCFCAVFRAC